MKTRLKYWRRRRGMSQLDLATRAGVSNQTIVNIERYGKEPIASTVRKLAQARDIHTDDLFTEDPVQFDGVDDDKHAA